MIGEEYWFIPKFTGQKDPTLLSYLGLSGEEHRQKLAERFKRPTTWRRYCEEISLTNCQFNDTAAVRAPTVDDGANAERFFVEGLYQGYFRFTNQNNCTTNPTTCTGHIFNYPCTWTSYVVPQTYHLNIALTSDTAENSTYLGYTYGQLVDGLKAANATKSDMVILWWTPEAVRIPGVFVRMDRQVLFSRLTISIASPFVVVVSRVCWYGHGIDQNYFTTCHARMLGTSGIGSR